jgi:hypothetical protein
MRLRAQRLLARNKKMIWQRGSTRLWRKNLTGCEKKHWVPSFWRSLPSQGCCFQSQKGKRGGWMPIRVSKSDLRAGEQKMEWLWRPRTHVQNTYCSRAILWAASKSRWNLERWDDSINSAAVENIAARPDLCFISGAVKYDRHLQVIDSILTTVPPRPDIRSTAIETLWRTMRLIPRIASNQCPLRETWAFFGLLSYWYVGSMNIRRA